MAPSALVGRGKDHLVAGLVDDGRTRYRTTPCVANLRSRSLARWPVLLSTSRWHSYSRRKPSRMLGTADC
jgi:hypothetical protein